MRRRPVCLVCLLLLLCMCIADRMGFSLITGNPLSESMQEWIADHPDAVIRGEVREYKAAEGSFSACLNHVFLIYQSKQLPIENVKINLTTDENLRIGMWIEVSGKLTEIENARNPGEFDLKQYYACRHIYYRMNKGIVKKKSEQYSVYGQWLADVRQKFAENYERSAGEDAGVFEAMLLGTKENLNDELKFRYQMAGMIHILAISGVHISILGLGLFNFLRIIGTGNIPSGLIALAVILQYGILTGESVSAMRAVCMFVIMTGARILGRSYDVLTALAVSAILLVLESPAYIQSSSFLLSFGAVAGLGAAAPVMHSVFGVKKKTLKSLLSSLSVQLITLPLLLTLYGEVSMAGFILNLVVLPTVNAVLLSGLAAGILGFISIRLSFAAAMPGRVILWVYEILCKIAAKIPFCTWIPGAPNLPRCILYYFILTAGLLTAWYWKKKTMRRLCLGATLFVCVFLMAFRPQKELSVTCLDVGQGDCAVISIPHTGNVLIDCGSSNKNETAKYQLIPFLKHEGISYLSCIIVTHTDGDHISGIKELLEFMDKNLTMIRADTLALPKITEPGQDYLDLVRLAEKAGIRTVFLRAGDTLRLGQAAFSVLSPEKNEEGTDINEASLVSLLRYGDFRGLFTGDIGEETEKKLLGKIEEVNFLKVAHHGSKYSSGEEFLKKANPQIAVISCSSTNNYGHPSQQTLEHLKEINAEIYCTKDSGAVTVFTNGKKIRAEVFVSD